MKKVIVDRKLVFCEKIIFYGIGKSKGRYCEIYFHKEKKK
jgi:hypothetical protein